MTAENQADFTRDSAEVVLKIHRLCLTAGRRRALPEYKALPTLWQRLADVADGNLVEGAKAELDRVASEGSLSRTEADAVLEALRVAAGKFDRPTLLKVADPGAEGEDDGPPPTFWPDPLDKAALHGLAGEFVRIVAPESEGDPVALLLQFLVGSGNLFGRNAYVRVGADRHYANEFMCLVGDTASGRKGSSLSRVITALQAVDDGLAVRKSGGLSSGEGLMFAVRDPVETQTPIREGGKKDGKIVGYQTEVVDHGVDDKRLLVVETEFGRTLKTLGREGNTLSAVCRQAWDTGTMSNLTKNPMRDERPHQHHSAHHGD